MKLQELMEQKNQGTYAGVKFDKATTDALKKFIVDAKLPNAVAASKMHTTLLYSRKYLSKYKPQGKIDPPYEGTPTTFEVWESQPDEDGHKSKCLVLKYKCPELVKRHKSLMKEHNATFDYPEYKTHVTLSYDIGDFDVDDLPNIKDYLKKIVIVKEYGEDLDLDWAKNNSKGE